MYTHLLLPVGDKLKNCWNCIKATWTMVFISLSEIPEFGSSAAGCKYPNWAKYFCKTTNTKLQSNPQKVFHSIKITFSWDLALCSLVQRYLSARPLKIPGMWCCVVRYLVPDVWKALQSFDTMIIINPFTKHYRFRHLSTTQYGIRSHNTVTVIPVTMRTSDLIKHLWSINCL